MPELKTMEGWNASRQDLDKYLAVGDPVDEAMFDYFLNVLPPAYWTDRLLQIGEPVSHVDGRPTFATLKRLPGGQWAFAGNCHRGQSTEPVPPSSRDTADAIAQWLGGYGPVKVMVGVTHFTYAAESLTFDFQMCPKANRCRITYDAGADLYDVRFFKANLRSMNIEPVEEIKGVYGEDLRRIFEDFTGLTLIIPRVRRA